MRRYFLVSLALGAALFVSDVPAPGRAADHGPAAAPLDPDRLRPGMSQAEVRNLLGPPKQVARQILYRRYLEQWVYDAPNAVRIEFDCVRGREPQILTVHPLTPARP